MSNKPFSFILFLTSLLVAAFATSDYEKAQNLKTCISSLNTTAVVYKVSDSQFWQLKQNSYKNDFVTPIAFGVPKTESDVSALVTCAKTAGMGVCARSGGHSYLGANQCAGLVIDLSLMRSITMDTSTNIATVETGAVLAEVLYTLKTNYNRWLSTGICPTVGVAGYTLGGGHGPYEGSLGLMCDSLESLRMVDAWGNILDVSPTSNAKLFWASCGAGGGQFSIVTSMRFATDPSAPFDRSVGFRFTWPIDKAGEVMEKYQYYDEAGGKTWVRMEISQGESVLNAWGACYEVDSTAECLSMLQKGDFFNVAGRSTSFLQKMDNALDLHAFFGPAGGWGRNKASDLQAAFLNQRGTENGNSNTRATQSSFLELSQNKKDASFWQAFINFCTSPNAASVPWMVCQLNLFHNAVSTPRQSSFPFRNADMLTQIIIGGGSDADKDTIYNWMKNYFKDLEVGVYVNYPETRLSNYATAYWGSSLNALAQLKKIYDSNNFFLNPQPIPWSRR